MYWHDDEDVDYTDNGDENGEQSESDDENGEQSDDENGEHSSTNTITMGMNGECNGNDEE